MTISEIGMAWASAQSEGVDQTGHRQDRPAATEESEQDADDGAEERAQGRWS